MFNRHLFRRFKRIISIFLVVNICMLSFFSDFGFAFAKSNKIPVAAGAYKYSPKSWNKLDLRKATNCYAYAFEFKKDPVVGAVFTFGGKRVGIIPGQYSSPKYKNSLYDDGINLKNIVKRIKSDCKRIGYKFTKVSGSNITKKINNKKSHLVYLTVSEYEEETMLIDEENKVIYNVYPDFHFYRQDKNKYWSHKRGNNKVSNLDEDNKKISVPSKVSKFHLLGKQFLEKNGEIWTSIDCILYNESNYYKVTRK